MSLLSSHVRRRPFFVPSGIDMEVDYHERLHYCNRRGPAQLPTQRPHYLLKSICSLIEDKPLSYSVSAD